MCLSVVSLGHWVSVLLCTILAGWLLLSVIVQFFGASPTLDRFLVPVRAKDRYALLPAWTFFAPRPGQTDVHLLVRDISGSAAPAAWREVFPDRGMRAFDAVWDPHKRAKKILVDFTQGLMEKAYRDTSGRFRLTGEYICLANYVVHLDSAPFATHRQFAIAETCGDAFRDQVQIMFVSDVHPVEAADRGA